MIIQKRHKLDKLIKNYKKLNIKLIDLVIIIKRKTEVNPCYPW